MKTKELEQKLGLNNKLEHYKELFLFPNDMSSRQVANVRTASILLLIVMFLLFYFYSFPSLP